MTVTRRHAIQGALATAATAVLAPSRARARARQAAPETKPIPATGEAIPIVGLGTWITFNVGEDPVLRDECAAVMAAFFDAGGRVIDSSPMYGSSQPVVGYGLDKLGRTGDVFSADKVWTSRGGGGREQIEESRRYWGVEGFDLMQVHNLVAWQAHLDTLYAMKEAGEIRHIGITTSEGRRHDTFEQIMQDHALDFIQVTYNIVDREVESRILPLAAERGMAVMVNRPFQQKALIRQLEGRPLPSWAGEIGAATWAQVILKFIVSHPAVTVAIPATTRVDHVRENMAAAAPPFPDPALRRRMAAYVADL